MRRRVHVPAVSTTGPTVRLHPDRRTRRSAVENKTYFSRRPQRQTCTHIYRQRVAVRATVRNDRVRLDAMRATDCEWQAAHRRTGGNRRRRRRRGMGVRGRAPPRPSVRIGRDQRRRRWEISTRRRRWRWRWSGGDGSGGTDNDIKTHLTNNAIFPSSVPPPTKRPALFKPLSECVRRTDPTQTTSLTTSRRARNRLFFILLTVLHKEGVNGALK